MSGAEFGCTAEEVCYKPKRGKIAKYADPEIFSLTCLEKNAAVDALLTGAAALEAELSATEPAARVADLMKTLAEIRERSSEAQRVHEADDEAAKARMLDGDDPMQSIDQAHRSGLELSRLRLWEKTVRAEIDALTKAMDPAVAREMSAYYRAKSDEAADVLRQFDEALIGVLVQWAPKLAAAKAVMVRCVEEKRRHDMLATGHGIPLTTGGAK